MTITKRFLVQFGLTVVLIAGLGGCANQAMVPTPAPSHTAVLPVPRDEKWVTRHQGFVELSHAGGIQVMFLGDSITDFWRDPRRGKPIWDAELAPMGAGNYGISGDRTQHVLWRIANGELDGVSPKVVVLMIGTNNTGIEKGTTTPRNTPAEAIDGVRLVVQTLRAKLPSTRILLLAVFPRGERPDDPQRLQVDEINGSIGSLHDGRHVFYLDIGKKFLAADGTLSKQIMPDFLHPGPAGYRIWADAIREPLHALLADGRVDWPKASH